MTAAKATDEQIIEALKTMTVAQAAAHFGMHERSLWARKAAMVRKGWSPDHDMVHIVPDGFRLKGTSSLYKEGVKEPVLQWVKTAVDHERQHEMMVAACEAMSQDLPQIDPVRGPISTLAHLMAVYPIGDAHIGMRAWGGRNTG